jgi:uncharacterized protein (TIGR03382 family)
LGFNQFTRELLQRIGDGAPAIVPVRGTWHDAAHGGGWLVPVVLVVVLLWLVMRRRPSPPLR